MHDQLAWDRAMINFTLVETICGTGAHDKVKASLNVGRDLMRLLSTGQVKQEAQKEGSASAGQAMAVDGGQTGKGQSNPLKEVLDYSDAEALGALDFAEFFSRDGADLEMEVLRAREHPLFPGYMEQLRAEIEDDWTLLVSECGTSLTQLGNLQW